MANSRQLYKKVQTKRSHIRQQNRFISHPCRMDRTNGDKLGLNTMFPSQQIQSSGQLTIFPKPERTGCWRGFPLLFTTIWG